MALKPNTRRGIFYFFAALIAVVLLSIVLLPPMFTLNNLKPKIEAAITAQTGVETQINGDVHFSLIGAATIVARDITIPNGHIGAASFRIPISSLFDLEHAHLSKRIGIYDANIKVSQLGPIAPEYDIDIHNCSVDFLDKEYRIISGIAGDGNFQATVRTDQHKYDITLNHDAFYVTNKTNNLVIIGNLTQNGGARGTMSLQTQDINRMFEFPEPKIPGLIDLEMNFDWDGGYGFRFSNIVANNFAGNIDLAPDGRRHIQLSSGNTVFDFSFLLNPTHLIDKTSFDLNLRGRLKLAGQTFSHLIIQAAGSKDALKITKIVADDTVIVGGQISAAGAQNLAITTKIQGSPATCMFSGTPQQWSCEKFTYRGMTGTLSVDGDTITATVSSSAPMPDESEIISILNNFGRRGTVKFIFANAAGTIFIEKGKIRTDFKFARDKTLSWNKDDIYFIPTFMRKTIGDFTFSDDRTTFRPHNGRWELTTEGNAFVISGRSLHDWFPETDMRAIADSEYFISGLRRGNTISNLTVRFLGHEFSGSASGDKLTLKTDTLNLDALTSQSFIDNYDEMEFLTDAPIMLPFGFNVNISLNADKLIYNGDEYNNFVYSLKNNVQTFSITDHERGNLLAIITRKKREYDISVQASKFKITGPLLSTKMPLNVSDTRITGEADIHTSGQIAHDISYNMTGTIDAVFSGGTITGFGIDEFYASAPQITTFNAEYAISNALDGGVSALKEMSVKGEFARRDFQTTSPLTISMRHATATGALEITDGLMRANMDIVLRGTSPEPSRISLQILPTDARRYSLSEIMRNFDSSYLRDFVATHGKF